MSQTYAVVDIETTGTDVDYDKVIQVGCILIEDGKVVGEYTTDINPASGFDKHIQTLTGLTPSRLRKAPYFEEIAPSLRSFLDGTIFVAHNIGFDYHFLNEAFKKVGQEPLNMPGIDTVALSQILFPTEVSFKLKDLTESFGFHHENPHQADSDARVTAELFLKLEEKLKAIPLTTLKKMVPYLFALPYETGNWMYEMYEKRLNEGPKNYPDLLFHHDLAFKTPDYYLKEEKKEVSIYHYPTRNQGKTSYYPENYHYRKIQGKMMNRIYRFFDEEEKALFLEAPFGIGKTFGYLFPLSFLLQKDKKVVVATSTIVLQHQLLEEINELSEKLPFDFKGVILKSGRHFLSLERFWKSLQEEETSKKIALYKLMILTWLLETTTGDFTELNLIAKDEDYFYQISSFKKSDPNSSFQPFEYYDLLMKSVEDAQVIVTNHSYLMEASLYHEELFKKAPYLVVDEAHQLPTYIRNKNKTAFHYSSVKKMISFDESREDTLGLGNALSPYLSSFHELVDYFKRRLKEDVFYLTEETFLSLPDKVKLSFDSLHAMAEEIEKLMENSEVQETYFYLRLKELLKEIQCFLTIDRRHISWVSKEKNDISFQSGLVGSLHVSKEKWYQSFEKVLFIGASFYYGRENLLQEELQIENSVSNRLTSPYSYEKQLGFYYLKNSKESSEEETLVEALKDVIKRINKPILVLFTSQSTLKNIYFKLQDTALEYNREILAQDITGTKEKNLKRFKLGEKSILLGNMAFWEGIDLPKDRLEILFIAKLPFENPQWPVTKISNSYLDQKGDNAFDKRTLPHCVLKLNQALGRLIRSEKDRGVAFIFDERIENSPYAKRIQRHLIPGIQVKTAEVEDATKIIEDFLQL